MFFDFIETELGKILLLADYQGLRQLTVCHPGYRPNESWQYNPNFMRPYTLQLKEYLAGKREKFTFTIAPQGTQFQQKIWAAIVNTPYGQTTTYHQIAEKIGIPSATQAIGIAKNVNPIPIVIPCHRIINTEHCHCGYRYGCDVVDKLLALESRKLKLVEEA
ncbi:TPA: methylated-DNA--[protein]-cysteine S-methyltransferase [Photobacterium damselae]